MFFMECVSRVQDPIRNGLLASQAALISDSAQLGKLFMQDDTAIGEWHPIGKYADVGSVTSRDGKVLFD